MKILHINVSSNNGGAAKACKRLHDALLKSGIQSSILTINEENTKENVIAVHSSSFNKMVSSLTFLLEIALTKVLVKKNTVPFSFGLFGTNITQTKAFKEADIIHLHWINHGFLSLSTLKKIVSSTKKTAWTFHDSWASTGGCHVKAGCTNYLNSCTNCPIITPPFLNDIPTYFFNKKQNLFSNNTIHIVTPSNWLANEVKKSPITQHSSIINIANPINTDLYTPANKKDASVLKILIGYMKINAAGHKGFSYAIEALNSIKEYYKTAAIEVFIFGCKEDDLRETYIPFNYKALGFIRDEKEMIKAYQEASIYIAPFLEDNFPNTVLEALSCGTPVIGFNAGGIPEMVKHLENGYLAQSHSSKELADGIQVFIDNPAQIETMASKARASVVANFSEKVIADKFVDFYNQTSSS